MTALPHSSGAACGTEGRLVQPVTDVSSLLNCAGAEQSASAAFSRDGEPWTDDELRELARLWRVNHYSWAIIATKLHRSERACKHKFYAAERAGVVGQKEHSRPRVRPATTPRRCLGCGAEFASWGAGNRMCDGCRGRSVSPFAPA